jgi:hypothetical protein
LYDLLDPNVEIIFLTLPISPEAIEQIKDYLQAISIRLDSDVRDRVHFIIPDLHYFFPKSASISSVFLASPDTMETVKDLISNRIAYIVPGIIGGDDYKMSSKLNIPLLSANNFSLDRFCNRAENKKFVESCGLKVTRGNITSFINFFLTM